jgi:peptidyl-prolyl cis-trans isomerase SurA
MSIVAQGAKRVMVDGVAAHVNEDVIRISEVIAVLQPMYRRLAYKYRGNDLKKKLSEAYDTSLNTLIDRSLILYEYEKQEARIPDFIFENRIKEIINDSFQGDRQVLRAALEKDHMSYDDWKKAVKERMIVSSMRSSNLGYHVGVSPAAVRKYYLANKEKYKTGGEVRMRIIVISRKSDDGADKIEATMKALSEGKDFAEVARKYSEGDKAGKGGDWGWVDPGILRSELMEAVQSLKKGSHSKVINTAGEWYVVKVEDRKSQNVMTMDEAREFIEKELKSQRADRLYREWMDRLRKDAYVKVFDAKLYQ